MTSTRNMMTVDVEDWFHILETDDSPQRDRWESLESRVEANTDRLLTLLDEGGARATFFVVGWVAWRHPQVVRRIAAAGHEIASHGFWHEVVRRHDAASLRADLRASKCVLEDLAGQRVEGYRAAGNSITPADAWAFDLIREAGYTYDASLCPAPSSHGGFPQAYCAPHLVRCASGELAEIPSSTFGAGRWRIPYAGGGYIRLFPQLLLRAAIGVENALGRPANLYVHPRDIDPEQPRMPLRGMRRFKYYVGLATTERKLRGLMRRHSFVGARRWLGENRPQLLGKVLDVRDLARAASPAPDPAYRPPLPPVTVGT